MPNLELIPPRVVRGLGVRPVPSELGRGGCRGLACCVAASTPQTMSHRVSECNPGESLA